MHFNNLKQQAQTFSLLNAYILHTLSSETQKVINPGKVYFEEYTVKIIVHMFSSVTKQVYIR